uniref:Capsid protein n=1 Tax=Betatorquevirus homini1 TaxID=3048395 RepID=A0AAU8H488_9VIRU
MPPFYFYRRRWRPNRRWRWRRRFTTRRPRRLIRRRFWRRNWVRRRYFTKKKKRKLKKIKLHQWQPDQIKKCRIKGHLCLLTCGKGKINNNFTLTSESYVPTKESGGGGWSIMQLTLRALYDEYVHYRNWWTTSNCGLPLTRYMGVTVKFYKSNDTDYIVTVQHTGPFEVTRDIYLSTQPSRHMMNHKSFIIPKLNPNKKKRPYIKKRFYPPAMWLNKWYFQQDIYNHPLILFIVSACSLDQMYCPNDGVSTNITFLSLNTDLFQNPYWETDNNEPYYPKVTGTLNTALFEQGNGGDPNTQKNWQKIALLGNTTQFKILNHNTIQNLNSYDKYNKKENWGNPFSTTHRDSSEDIPIYYGNPPTSETYDKKPNILPITGLYQECRYNPFRDKGKDNKVYIKCTKKFEGSFTSLPTDERLLVRDMPLWLIFWGWQSWLQKSTPVQHLLEDYQFVIQSNYIYPPMKSYVPLDQYFTTPQKTPLTETDKQHWHPKAEYQQEVLAAFAATGPAAPKINKQNQIQIHCFYDFYFKWGGCPTPMETVCNPADQEKFPTPNNLIQEPTIQNPETPKEHYLYKFDERQGFITAPAAKRLKTDIETPKYFTEYGTRDPILEVFPPTDQTQKKKTTEEEKDPLQLQLQQLQLYQQHLRDRINRLTKRSKLFPIL